MQIPNFRGTRAGDGGIALRANLGLNFEPRYLRNRKSEPDDVYTEIALEFPGNVISTGFEAV